MDDLEPILRAVEGGEIILPERTMFYRTREVGVRASGGFNIDFAAPAEE